MSDVEEPTSPAPVVDVPAEGSGNQMSVLEALKRVLNVALVHDGLARGLRECTKALDRRQAFLCILNTSCEEEAYKNLITALCHEHKIPLIEVQDGKQLGEWVGLCKIDRDGEARNIRNCSSVVVTNWGEDTAERAIIQQHFESQ